MACTQHHDFVGQSHRLNLIVGHVNHRRADFLVQTRNFHPHFHAQFGIEVRQWFVEQKHLGATHNGAPDRDTLTLAA